MVAILEAPVLTTRPARVLPWGSMFSFAGWPAFAGWSAVLAMLPSLAAEGYMYEKKNKKKEKQET